METNMNRVDRRKVLLKSLAILAQPGTLFFPQAGIQLIAQGSIYAITDSVIGKDSDFPDIGGILKRYDPSVQSVTKEIIENYNEDEFIHEFSSRFCTAEERAKILVKDYCEKYPNQYSDQEKNQISTALGEYLISVRNCILQNPNSVRMIHDLFGNSINQVNDRIEEIEKFIAYLKSESQSENSVSKDGINTIISATNNKEYIGSFRETNMGEDSLNTLETEDETEDTEQEAEVVEDQLERNNQDNQNKQREVSRTGSNLQQINNPFTFIQNGDNNTQIGYIANQTIVKK